MHRRIRIKFCGITRPEDAVRASEAGADAIGLVFHPQSPRAIGIAQAQAILAAAPAFLTRVGVFVDTDAAELRALLEAVPLDVLQFHGDEPPEYCAAFGRPYVKAVRMREGTDVTAVARRHPGAAAILVDTYDPLRHGGTGAAFDWTQLPPRLDRPLVLAGGLTPDNVRSACRIVRPYAVDVSGGIEGAPGVKDPRKMYAFADEVRAVEQCDR